MMQRIIDWLKGNTQYWRNRAEIAEGKLTDLDEEKARVARWYKEWCLKVRALVEANERIRFLETALATQLKGLSECSAERERLRDIVSGTLTQGE